MTFAGSPLTRSIGVAMIALTTSFAAALAGCTPAAPELTSATIQAFVDTRVRGLQSRDTQALCDQYAENVNVNGVFGDEPVTLNKRRYCEHVADVYAALATGQERVDTQLSVKSMTIAANGQSAEVEQEQIDVIDWQPDAATYELRTQIISHVESVAGTPLVTREARTQTLLQTLEAPAQGAETTTRSASSPVAAEARDPATEATGDDELQNAERARAERKSDFELANARQRACAQRRAELAYLERIVRDGLPPGEIMTAEELAAVPAAIDATKAYLAQECP